MKNLKSQKGITLVALVVTIIVLLILAGVALNLVAGGDGVLSKASSASQANARASAREAYVLEMANWQSEYYDAVYVKRTEKTTTKLGDYIFNQKYDKANNKKITIGEHETTVTADGENYKVTIIDNATSKDLGGENIEGILKKDGTLKWYDDKWAKFDNEKPTE